MHVSKKYKADEILALNLLRLYLWKVEFEVLLLSSQLSTWNKESLPAYEKLLILFQNILTS